MRRRSTRKQETRVALFPFLAVLVCTMGALIVLLVLVVQQARVQAVEITPPAVVDDSIKLAAQEQQREDLLWRSSILENQREEKTTELADSRLALSHLEDHLIQMEKQWEKLLGQRRAIQKLAAPQQADINKSRQQLDELQIQLQRARTELEQARRELKQRPTSYAIIPYHGPQATRRRPFYVECTPVGLIIQPEQILLAPRDLEGPAGPGNPLAAVLRAKREYYRRLGDQQEPYPLIIVRSDGILAYGAARRAMQGWDDEFGYELVAADRELHFPPADANLTTTLEQVIELARKRQAALARAMPRRYQSTGPATLRATTNRGFVRSTSSGRGTLTGTRRTRRPGSRGAGRPAQDQAATTTPDRPSNATAETRNPALPGTGESTPEGADPASQARSPTSRLHPTGAEPDRSDSGSTRTTSHRSAGAGSTSLGNQSAPPLSDSRGKNFALPNFDSDLTEIQRPIRIGCFHDRLVIQKERGVDARALTIPLNGALVDDVESFIARIWDRMERWGLAIPGGYWRPVLKVDVAPGAESRFAELSTLLQNSGVIVERTKP